MGVMLAEKDWLQADLNLEPTVKCCCAKKKGATTTALNSPCSDWEFLFQTRVIFIFIQAEYYLLTQAQVTSNSTALTNAVIVICSDGLSPFVVRRWRGTAHDLCLHLFVLSAFIFLPSSFRYSPVPIFVTLTDTWDSRLTVIQGYVRCNRGWLNQSGGVEREGGDGR